MGPRLDIAPVSRNTKAMVFPASSLVPLVFLLTVTGPVKVEFLEAVPYPISHGGCNVAWAACLASAGVVD